MARLLFIFDIGFDREGPSVHLLQDILKVALEEGNYVDVILKDTNGPLPLMPAEFAIFDNFNYVAIKEEDEKGKGFIKRYINEVNYAKKCGKYFLNNKKYDAVFLQSNPVAFFYMRLIAKLKSKIVFNVQDIFPYNLLYSGQLPFAKILFPILRKLQNMAYQRSNTIITISDDMKQTLVEDGVEESKIKVVYNWSYDDSPITKESIDGNNYYDLHMDHNKCNVVYAGNIGRMQNVELIVQAAMELQNDRSIQFYIIGNGANTENIDSMIVGLNNVTRLPMQNSKYAESIYAQADINIIPLMPGGIKTALPSKTATVLRTNTSIIFCIDSDSRFAQICKPNRRVYIADARYPGDLVSVINAVREDKNKGQMYEYCNWKLFSCENAKKYIKEMILQ